MFKATGHKNAYFPLFIPQELPREGGRARRGLRQGVRGRHAPPARRRAGRQARPRPEERARGAAGRPAHLRDDHRRDVRASGCRATATCRCSSTSGPTSCAGRCARACSCAPPSSSGRRGTPRTPRAEEAVARRADARRLRDVRRELDGDAGDQGPKDRARALPRRGRHLLHRGDDAGPQGAAGGHVALPRPELRQGLRHPLPDARGDARSTRGRRRGACRRASSAAWS
jgi:hypothetical protein